MNLQELKLYAINGSTLRGNHFYTNRGLVENNTIGSNDRIYYS